MYPADVIAQPVRSHFPGEPENARVSQALWTHGWRSLWESRSGAVCDCPVCDRLLPLHPVLWPEEIDTERAHSRWGVLEGPGEVM